MVTRPPPGFEDALEARAPLSPEVDVVSRSSKGIDVEGRDRPRVLGRARAWARGFVDNKTASITGVFQGCLFVVLTDRPR
ncbi:MAG TPA: hypothetical protein VNC60_08355 [Actinomycetota bacterium]|nr:hypothetical protein [Actinomycetota bacterium]